MSEDQFDRSVLSRAAMDRRSFIKKVVLGTAFAVPVVASFDMLTSSMASGVTCSVPNGTSGSAGQGTTGGNGGTRSRQSQGTCGGTPNGGTGGGQAQTVSDRARKTAVLAVVWS
jgi:hypothetical protein